MGTVKKALKGIPLVRKAVYRIRNGKNSSDPNKNDAVVS